MSGIISGQRFYGGRSENEYIGAPEGFRDSVALNIHRSPTEMRVMPDFAPSSTEFSGARVVKAFEVNGQQLIMFQNALYVLGARNKDTLERDYTLIANVDAGFSLTDACYASQSDTLYFTANTYDIMQLPNISPILSSFQDAAFTPATISTVYPDGDINNMYSNDPLVVDYLEKDLAGQWVSTATRREGSTNASYHLSLGEVEDDTGRTVFMSNIPYPLKMRVFTGSTFAVGAATLIIHNPDDSVVATVTNTNSTSGANGYLDFPLNQVLSMGRVGRAAEYHFHIISGDTSLTVYSAVAEDAMGINFRLIGVLGDLSQYGYQGKHWMAMVDRRLAIGNLGFVALVDVANGTWADTNFQRDYIGLIDGDKAMVGSPTDEYLAISAITANGKGRLYFWTEIGLDGAENHAYNFMIDTDSYVEAIKNYQNITYLLMRGVLHAWEGGKKIRRMHRMIELDEEYSDVGLEGWIEAQADGQLKIEVPNYMDVYGGLLRISPLGSSLSAVFLENQNYIFSYGRLSESYPLAMARGQKINGYCQGIATGSDSMIMTTLNPERIGISNLWYIDRFSPPCATWSWENLHIDTDNLYKEKLNMRYVVAAKDLYPLSRIRLVIQENGRDPEYSDWYDMGVDKLFYYDIERRSTSIMLGFEGETLRTPTIGQPPIISSWALEVNTLNDEKQV